MWRAAVFVICYPSQYSILSFSSSTLLRTFGDALLLRSATVLECTLDTTTVPSSRLNSSLQSCFFNVSDPLVDQQQTVIVRDFSNEPLLFAIRIIHPMSIDPIPLKISFSGKEIVISGRFPIEIPPYRCFCESLSSASILGDILVARSTASNVSCVFLPLPSSRCQVGVSDGDGRQALTAVFLVADMHLVKIQADDMVVEHLSTVAMAGRNLLDGLSYDCLLGSSTFTAHRISDSLIRCDVVPFVPGNFLLIGRVEGVPSPGPSVHVHVSSQTQVLDFAPTCSYSINRKLPACCVCVNRWHLHKN